MAKGARASSRKRNNAALRAKIFGPAVDARTERLSAKLQELVSKPKSVEEKDMLVDSENAEELERKDAENVNIVDEMDIDGQKRTSKSKQKQKQNKSKIEKKKKGHKKARNSIIFPSITRRNNGPGISKGKR